MTRRLWVTLPLLLVAMLGLVTVGVWPQLSARAAGDEIRLRVEPVDPIDPFRGAYVALSYPDLRHNESAGAEGGQGSMDDGESGTVFLTLRQKGDHWVASGWTRKQPTDTTYLRCSDTEWQIRCGIESWFVPQDEATALEKAVSDGDVVATVKVDDKGHAALIGVGQE